MKDNIYAVLSKLCWTLFFLFIFLNIVNWLFIIQDDVLVRKLPFEMIDGKAVNFSDSTLISILENKTIVMIDTLDVSLLEVEEESSSDGLGLLLFDQESQALNILEDQPIATLQSTI